MYIILFLNQCEVMLQIFSRSNCNMYTVFKNNIMYIFLKPKKSLTMFTLFNKIVYEICKNITR